MAFVINVYARYIVGRRVSRSMTTGFFLDALERAMHARQPDEDGCPIHQSDSGSHCASICYVERLAIVGIAPSVRGIADDNDNTLVETINSL